MVGFVLESKGRLRNERNHFAGKPEVASPNVGCFQPQSLEVSLGDVTAHGRVLSRVHD